MKNCTKCLVEKEDSDFYEKRPDRKQSLCKNCFNEYCVQRWVQRKKDAVAYKGGKCQECGYCKNYGALDFHHRDSETKDFDWTKLRLRSLKSIKTELDKCNLLCKNCHTAFHNPQLDISPS